MPRVPTELDKIEYYLQQAARTIRESQQGDLEVERMRNEIYKHVYEAIEICARYAYAATPLAPTTGARTSTPRSPLTSPSGAAGRGGGATERLKISFAKDLDLLK